MKAFLKRLEQAAKREEIVIPLSGGGEARFPKSAGQAALLNLVDRAGSGDDAPPEHPLLAAARNSSDPEWVESVYAASDPEELVKPVSDLSEP
jgi:hypothetical protein